jgi:hypothetical protein
MPKPIRFRLNLSTEHYLRFYQGRANRVSVIAEDGRRIEFPANALRPFVTRLGVQGYFQLVVDADNRLLSLEQIGV